MRMRLGSTLVALALFGCDSITGPDGRQEVVIDDRIPARNYLYWQVALPKGGHNFRLKGSFQVTSGGNRDISAYVLDATEFVNFEAGNNAYGWVRERVTTGKFDLRLDRRSGPYYLVLDNQFSLLTDKYVKGSVSLTYD